jgi:hypothetical protein
VDSIGHFFAESAAVVRLPLRQTGEIFAEAGFRSGSSLKAREQLEIEEDEENKNCKDCPKHFLPALFQDTAANA